MKISIAILVVALYTFDAKLASGNERVCMLMEGSIGTVDYRRINNQIKTKFNAVMRDIRAEYDQKLHDMETKLINVAAECDVYYSNVCYWIENHDAQDISFATAESICRQRRSTVADIVDDTQYKLLTAKIRSELPSDANFINYWTGMQQNPSSGAVTLSSGSTAPYLSWRSGQPTRRGSATGVILRVAKDVASYQGMYDRSPSGTLRGVICQYELV